MKSHELKQEYENLKNRLDEIEDLYSINIGKYQDICEAGSLIATRSYEEILVLLMEYGLKIVDAEVGSIMLLENEVLTNKITWGLEEEIIFKIINPETNQNLAQDVLFHGAEIIDDFSQSKYQLKDVEQNQIESILSVPIHWHDETVGVITIINKTFDTFTQIDCEMLQTLATFAAVAIINQKLHLQDLERQKIEHELETANSIQSRLLPIKKPEISGLEIYGKSESARHIGGDYFDWIQVDDSKVFVALGDVSGKGVPAALIMTMVKTTLYSQIANTHNIVEIVERMNQYLCHELTQMDMGIFVTFFLALIDVDKKSVQYCNAGHFYPYLIKKEKVLRLHTDNYFLGFDENCSYNSNEESFEKDDLLFIFSDGVTEAMNVKNEIFSENRLEQFLIEYKQNAPEEIIENIFFRIQNFSMGLEQSDDTTAVAIKIAS